MQQSTFIKLPPSPCHCTSPCSKTSEKYGSSSLEMLRKVVRYDKIAVFITFSIDALQLYTHEKTFQNLRLECIFGAISVCISLVTEVN